MTTLNSVFSHRLRELCDTRESVSRVAADLSINRQQFAKYLNGSSLPRQAIIDAISQYFSVEPGALFQEQFPATPNTEDDNSEQDPTGVSALVSLLKNANFEPIADNDLMPGFYAQTQRSSIREHKVIRTLALVSKKEGAYLYKSIFKYKLWKDPEHSYSRVIFNGVFLKMSGNLVLVDLSSPFKEIAFHVLKTSYLYNQNFKPGLQIAVNSETLGETGGNKVFLRKLNRDESVLRFARNQGWIDEEDLPDHVKEILNSE